MKPKICHIRYDLQAFPAKESMKIASLDIKDRFLDIHPA